MSEELKELQEYNLEYLEAQTSEEMFGGDFVSAVELKYAKKEIERLKERIDYLERSNNRREDEILELRQENADLDNIVSELEKILDEDVELVYVHNGKRQYNKTLTEGGLLFRDYIKSKLQELKGD